MAKVLLVEDDNNLREIYQARLTAEGYDIVAAQNGEEALVVAKQNKPDLIISDVMMPRISGFEMLDILRNTEQLKHTKVIMLTALGQAEDQKRADALGADKYLVKSQVTLEDIVNAAKELLGETGDDASSAITAVPPAPEPVQTTPAVAAAPPEPVAVPTPPPASPVAQVEPVTTPQAAVAPTVPSPAPEPVAAPAVVTPPAPVAEAAPTVITPTVQSVATTPEPVAEPTNSVVPATPAVAAPTPVAMPVTPAPEVAAEPAQPVVSMPVPAAATEPASIQPAPNSADAANSAQTLAVEEAALQAQISDYAQAAAEPALAVEPTQETPGAATATPTPEPAVAAPTPAETASNEAANDAAIAQAVQALNSPQTAPVNLPPSMANAPSPAPEPVAAPAVVTPPAPTVTPAPEPTPAPTTPVAEAAPAAPAPTPAATPLPNGGIAGKKVIQPITDGAAKPSLDELLAKEESKAAPAPATPVVNGAATPENAGGTPQAHAPGESFDPNVAL